MANPTFTRTCAPYTVMRFCSPYTLVRGSFPIGFYHSHSLLTCIHSLHRLLITIVDVGHCSTMVGFVHISGTLIDSMMIRMYISLVSPRLADRHPDTVLLTLVFATLTNTTFPVLSSSCFRLRPMSQPFHLWGERSGCVMYPAVVGSPPSNMAVCGLVGRDPDLESLRSCDILPFKVANHPREGRGVGWEGGVLVLISVPVGRLYIVILLALLPCPPGPT